MAAASALLERENELARIGALLEDTADGSGRVLTIEGEAGAGKTALLEATGQLAADRGMRVLRARGGEFERDFPYGVMRQLFEPLLADEATRAELLSGSAALAAPVFELADPVQEGNPLAVQHGLYWLAADVAAETPTALLVDDAQWADMASLHALAYAGRRFEGIPILLALTVRSGEPGGHEDPLDELREERIAEAIEPPPLSAAAAAVLIESEIGTQPSAELAAVCRDSTAGNPFLLVELLRSLGPGGIEENEDAKRLAEIAATGVSRSLLTRLARLGGHSAAVARAVAVLEPNAEIRLIAELADLALDSVATASELLIRARLLSDTQPVAFVHPLVREAVLSELPAPRLSADHGRAARLLERDGAVADTVAAHLLLAERRGDDWAVNALRSAADGALSRGAPETAVRYLRRALQEPPPKPDRAAVSRELGLALLRASDREGIEVLRTVRAATEDPVARAQLAQDIATSLGIRGGGEEAARLLEESLERIDRSSELGILVRATLLLQVVWGLERIPTEALPGPGEDLGSGSFAERVLLGQAAALNAVGMGEISVGLELAKLSAPSVEAIVADATAGLPHQGTFAALFLADRGDLVAELFQPSIEASRQRGVPLAVAGGHGIRAIAELLDGNLTEAGGDADIAMHIMGGVPLPGAIGVWAGGAIRIATGRGDFAAAERLLFDPWGRQPPPTGSPAAIFLCARGELRRATGRHAEARHDYLAAAERIAWLPLANQELYPWRIGLAQCEAALGNEERASDLAAEAVALARRAGGTRGIGIALRVDGALRRGPEGIELLREAVDLLAGTRARLEHARALVELGAALRRANRRKDARAPLRKGLETAHRCGAIPLEEQARTELAATGARPRRAVYTGVDSLTPSELRVARLAAAGSTNREIAQSLTVTEKTIETHMRHVFQKLDVGRRGELAGVLASPSGLWAPDRSSRAR
ncbi:MAG TPA: AAA family ATPase [Solirubrobacterales bacterium]|nr:AAA family ATPase [Solirubrobacterales bacterium]